MRFGLIAILAVALAATLGSTARADTLITASVDGGGPILLTSNGTDPTPGALAAFSGTIPGGIFSVSLLATSGGESSPPPEGHQGTSKLTVTQLVTGIHTIRIITSVNNYTQPSGSATASSSESGTVGSNTNGSLTYNAYLNNSNVLGAETTLIASGTASANTTAGGTSTLSPDINGSTVLTATPLYSLTMDELITLNGKNQSINSVGNTSVVGIAAVPEPGTVALALTGLPMLIGGAWLRRRRTHA